MPQSRQRVPSAIALAIAFSILAAACGDGIPVPPAPTTGRLLVETPTPPPSPEVIETPAGTAAAPTATTVPPSLVLPSPTQVPEATATEPAEPSATPLPLEPITFDPPQMVQGGAVIVHFSRPASGATLTFGGSQYPMLPNGDGWWAMIGVGAFAESGLAPVSVAYNPPNSNEAMTVAASIEIVARDFPFENINLDPQTASLLQPEIVNNEIAIRASVYSGFTAQRLWSGAFVAPAEGIISSIYGQGRSYNNGPVTDYHHGTDFIGDVGAPVYAAAAGRVVFVEELQVRGNTIIVDHGVGVMTAYNHLSAFHVSIGEEVSAGQRIGDIGSTGLVTGPHLHFEVVVRGVEVDPQLWLQGAYIGP